MLFQKLSTPDRSKTQLWYAANYFPWATGSNLGNGAERLVCWRRLVMMYKFQVVNILNEEATHLLYSPKPEGQDVQSWQIKWQYNAIPTEIEWEKKSQRYIISCDFRVLADGTKIVLLAFWLEFKMSLLTNSLRASAEFNSSETNLSTARLFKSAACCYKCGQHKYNCTSTRHPILKLLCKECRNEMEARKAAKVTRWKYFANSSCTPLTQLQKCDTLLTHWR